MLTLTGFFPLSLFFERSISKSIVAPSEDFAYYAEKFPACFFYIACSPKGVEKPYFNHHPKFDIDEDSLLVAAKAVGQVVCSMQE